MGSVAGSIGRLAQLARSETRRTLTNSLIGLLLSFGCGVLSARLLGPADRGVLSLTLVVTTTAAMVAALGSNVALRVAANADPRMLVRGYVQVSAMLLVLQAVLASSGMVLLYAILEPRTPLPVLVAWGVAVGLSAFVAQQTLDGLNSTGRTATSALAGASGSAATLVVLTLATLLNAGLEASLLGYVVGFVVCTAHAMLAYRRSGPTIVEASGQRGGGFDLVRRGMPLLGLNLGQALALKLDQLVVGALSGPAAAGIYAVAAAHALPTQASSFSIGQIVLHRSARGTLTRVGLAQFLGLGAGLAIVACLLVWLLAPWLVPAVFGAGFRSSVDVLRVLMLGQIALVPYLICSRVVAGRGQSLLASLSGIGLLLLLGGLLGLLTPRNGPVGAAWAVTLAFTLAAVVMVVATVLTSSPGRTLDATPTPPGALEKSVELA